LEVAGKYREAIVAYARILERVEDPRALINLGTIMHGRRQYDDSEALYRRATVAAPDYVIAWFNLGSALDELAYQGRREEAIEAYRTTLRLDPGYADAHYNLAVALEETGRPSLALNHYRAYLKLDSTSVFATRAKMKVWRAIRDTGFQVHRAPGKRQPVAIQ
jgi:tetratricopeptide (TPR) repeat protein